jgi:hypothetical protein
MRRRLCVVVVAALLAAGALAPIAAGLSSPNAQNDDIDVVFVDGSNNVKFVDPSGTVTDTGAQGVEAGGVGDLDDDSALEILIRDSSGNIKYTTTGGAVTDLGVDGTHVGAVADIDGDGDQDALYVDATGDVNSIDDGGQEALGKASDARSIGGVGDFDGDSDLEVVFTSINDEVSIVGPGDTAIRTGVDASDLGGVANVDGDAALEIIIRDPNGNVKLVEQGGATASVGVTASAVGGYGDADADGTDEIATVSGGSVVVATTSGSTTTLGGSAVDVGAVADVDDDGAFDSAPTLSSATPVSTTTSANPVTFSIDVADAEFIVGDTATVAIDLNGNQVAQTTVSSNTTVTTDVSGVPDGSNTWTVTATDSNGNSNSQSYTFTGDYAAPTLSNPDPTGSINVYDGDISIEVADADFGEGDSVDVSATGGGGNPIGSTTLNANGTATLSYDATAGSNSISWSATDSHGLTASASQSFDAPSQLTVRNVSSQRKVTGANATVQLYRAGNKTVIERNASNGDISLGGLPASATYVVSVSADGYETRRTLLRSVFEQQSVYLVPQNRTTHIVEFSISDRTGDFDSRAELQILRPLNTSNTSADELEYQVVAGDRIGSQSQVKVTLQDGVRYRIRIATPSGSTKRTLGAFVPRTDRIVDLKIGELRFAVATGQQTYNASARTLENQQGNVTGLRFAYNDPQQLTSSVQVSFQTANGSVLGNYSAAGPLGNYSATQGVTAATARNSTFVVKYELVRDGTTITGSLRPGLARYGPGIPLAPGLKQLFSVGFLLVVGGLFSAQNARVGAVVTPLFAAGLWFFNWLPPGTSILAIALALGVGVLANYGARQP